MTTYDDPAAPLCSLAYSLAPPDAPRARTVARWRRERFFAAMLLVPRRVSSRAARWGAAACAAGARCFLLTLGVCVLASLLPLQAHSLETLVNNFGRAFPKTEHFRCALSPTLSARPACAVGAGVGARAMCRLTGGPAESPRRWH